jgi:hypothetical protein
MRKFQISFNPSQRSSALSNKHRNISVLSPFVGFSYSVDKGVRSLELENWSVLIESVLQGRFFLVLGRIQLCCRTLRAHGKEWAKLLDLGKRQSSFFVVLLNANTRQTHKIDCFVGPTGPPHFPTSQCRHISLSFQKSRSIFGNQVFINKVSEVSLIFHTKCARIAQAPDTRAFLWQQVGIQ